MGSRAVLVGTVSYVVASYGVGAVTGTTARGGVLLHPGLVDGYGIGVGVVGGVGGAVVYCFDIDSKVSDCVSDVGEQCVSMLVCFSDLLQLRSDTHTIE